MAVHNLGYRGWSGELMPSWTRAPVIAGAGIRRAWQSRWLQRLVLFSWLPACYFAIGFLIWEQSLLYPQWREGLEPFLDGAPAGFETALRQTDDASMARHAMWAWLLQTFFRYPQGFVMFLVVGLIAPRLISQDIRSRAFLIYFSRPLGRGDYILGKFLIVWFYLAMISTAPALALYVLGVLLSPELGVLLATWDLPLRILGASAVLGIPTAALALWFSSMTQESRYASFAWFAVWILGWFTYGVMTSVEAFHNEFAFEQLSPWANCSLYHTLGRVQSWIFGFVEFADIRWSAFVLIMVTAVSLIMLFRRVGAPIRV